ncbi:MAG: hypothetical protein H6623_08540 [Bdellovibrionaceae bacterium]|nr:hypothetical protein [Pseudobdellovibrionaceae bacterium]
MKVFLLTILSLCFSAMAFAEDCPDLTGIYGSVSSLGLAIEIHQNQCESLTLTQYRGDGTIVTDDILLDGQFRVLPSMPQFYTAFTYDQTHLIGTANDINTNDKVRTFIMSLEFGGLTQQRLKYDNQGKIISDQTFTLPTCVDNSYTQQ